MPITPHMHRDDRLETGEGPPDVLLAAEVLSAEDIAILEAFLVRPTAGMDDVQLAARTLQPLSIVNGRVEFLVRSGLLRKSVGRKNGRFIYRLGGRRAPGVGSRLRAGYRRARRQRVQKQPSTAR